MKRNGAMSDYYQAMSDYYSNNSFYRGIQSLHFPIWDENTGSYEEASYNTNRVVAEALQIRAGDRVLDAGCGVGGTALFIAEHYQAQVVGITIVPSQVKLAQHYAKTSSVEDKVTFLLRDYTDTKFKPASFDKVFGVESVCHAVIKQDFLEEAYRILKPGGTIVVLDAYRIKRTLTEEEERIYGEFRQGFVLDNLAFKKDFANDMASVGFTHIRFDSKIDSIQKSLRYFYLFGTLFLPAVFLMEKLGVLGHGSLGHVVAAKHSKFLIDRKVLEYGLFIASKGISGLRDWE